MNLSVKERLILLNVLPSQETYENMLVLQDLKSELGLSEGDHEYLELVSDGDDIKWNPDKELVKDVPIGLVAYELIKTSLKKLDSDKAITLDILAVYQRFVENDAVVDIVDARSA